MTKKEVIDFIKAHKADIQKFGVVKIGLFGSYAREENISDSDIDIIVRFMDVESKYNAYFGLKNYLEDALKIKIDLCREEDIRKEFKDAIKRSVIYV